MIITTYRVLLKVYLNDVGNTQLELFHNHVDAFLDSVLLFICFSTIEVGRSLTKALDSFCLKHVFY